MTSYNGKICYLEIPSRNVQQSAEFYQTVFGWNIRTRGDGATAFDDTTGEVSGSFELNRPAATEPGVLIYIMADSAAEAVRAVVAAGGEIVSPIDPDFREIIATFRDPSGNLFGIYQEPEH
ncbi:MAG TPA: VOC family protein [Thermomicrobiales bacterium]|nr:VOC family protein [Thermomicrobiales bacterium]